MTLSWDTLAESTTLLWESLVGHSCATATTPKGWSTIKTRWYQFRCEHMWYKLGLSYLGLGLKVNRIAHHRAQLRPTVPILVGFTHVEATCCDCMLFPNLGKVMEQKHACKPNKPWHAGWWREPVFQASIFRVNPRSPMPVVGRRANWTLTERVKVKRSSSSRGCEASSRFSRFSHKGLTTWACV